MLDNEPIRTYAALEAKNRCKRRASRGVNGLISISMWRQCATWQFCAANIDMKARLHKPHLSASIRRNSTSSCPSLSEIIACISICAGSFHSAISASCNENNHIVCIYRACGHTEIPTYGNHRFSVKNASRRLKCSRLFS